MKTQKGITLIALIITIIVMLILVGVSVSVALNTGLFSTAQGAAKNTEGARVNETKLSNGTVSVGGIEQNINDYVDNLRQGNKTPALRIKVKDNNAGIPIGTYTYNLEEDMTWEDLIEQYPDVFANKDVGENVYVITFKGQEFWCSYDGGGYGSYITLFEDCVQETVISSCEETIEYVEGLTSPMLYIAENDNAFGENRASWIEITL